MADPVRRLDTFSGRRIAFAEDLDPSDFVIDDIAAALSKLCRFGGHARRFHSVAEHALLVHDLVIEQGRSDLAMAALHHDSAEAYAIDLPKPIKELISGYEDLCGRIDAAISTSLGFQRPNDDDAAMIKAADHRALTIEATGLLRDEGAGICGDLGLHLLPEDRGRVPVTSLTFGEAAERFIEAHHRARTARP
jgi:5'-deoxynucleotidase YfbR-like HD superfamily hydrolase